MPPPLARLLALGGALLAAGTALASGTRVGFKDAFALARGNAFVATADNPSAVYYNPAGLAHLDGRRLSAGVYHISLRSDYRSASGTASMDDGYQPVPQVFFSAKDPDAPWAYGIGVYAPFGLSTEWPGNSPLRTFALKNEQTYLTFNLSGAYRVTPTLSLGGGLTYNRVDTDLRRALGVFGPTDLFRFKGDGDAFGFTLGALWRPDVRHSFGLTYHSRTSVKLKGTTDTIPLVSGEPSEARFPFPDVVIVGYSFRPTPQWNLEVNLDWTNWDRFNTVTIAKPSGAVSLPFNWQSGFFYEFGATRYLRGGWNVSAGYVFTENSTPNDTFTPAVPDSDRSFYSLGTGYESGNLSAHLSWHYADGGSRTVTGSPPSLIGATADGTYENSINAFALSLELRF
ncbi:MAG: outer membrane protein transport protein [Opitutaceae bacterium]|nr:outer membrane protein transport protein [Opitutaceae bacterium]